MNVTDLGGSFNQTTPACSDVLISDNLLAGLIFIYTFILTGAVSHLLFLLFLTFHEARKVKELTRKLGELQRKRHSSYALGSMVSGEECDSQVVSPSLKSPEATADSTVKNDAYSVSDLYEIYPEEYSDLSMRPDPPTPTLMSRDRPSASDTDTIISMASCDRYDHECADFAPDNLLKMMILPDSVRLQQEPLPQPVMKLSKYCRLQRIRHSVYAFSSPNQDTSYSSTLPSMPIKHSSLASFQDMYPSARNDSQSENYGKWMSSLRRESELNKLRRTRNTRRVAISFSSDHRLQHQLSDLSSLKVNFATTHL